MGNKNKVTCLCSPPKCKNIEAHISKIKRLGETDEILIAMIRSGEIKSKILKKGERE